MVMTSRIALAVLFAAPCLAAAPASAGLESAWSAPTGTAVRLLAGAREGDNLTGGVEIRLSPGWKTYWRYPGDSGVPPRFDWSGSTNLADIEILWPVPIRFDDGDGNYSIGYKHDVVIPFKVTPKDASKPVDLKLALDFAVCEKICQPANAALDLSVPAGGAAPSSASLVTAQDSVPRMVALDAAGPLTIESAHLADNQIRIEARVENPAKADLFVEGPNEDWALPLPTRETGADGRTTFVLPVDGVPKGADIATTKLRFTLTDGTRAVEVETPLSTR